MGGPPETTRFENSAPNLGVQAGTIRGGTINIAAAHQPRQFPDLATAERVLAALPGDDAPVPPIAAPPVGSDLRGLARNPLFVGREADLRRLAGWLKAGQPAVIAGLGGLGKTQLAVEVVHRYGRYFAGGVFWLSFADGALVPSEIARGGEAAYLDLLPSFADRPLAERVARVRAVWQEPLPRLLIFDNCEAPALFADYRPPAGGCRVLLTSRNAVWEPALGVQVLPLGVLARAESLDLLWKHRPDLPAGDADLDAIATELDDLPLALHLAGSYLARYRDRVSPAAYLRQVQQPSLLRHRSLQPDPTTGFSPTGHELRVGRTFALSYQRLDQQHPTDAVAHALLVRASYLAPGEPMPRDLLLATLALPAADPEAALAAEDGLVRLTELGLIERQADGALRLHRLLWAFVRQEVADPAAQAAVEQTILDRIHELSSAVLLAPLVALQVHLREVTDAARDRGDERAATLCNTCGHFLRMIGDDAGARPYYEQALAIYRQVVGEAHLDTAASLNNLGSLLHDLGDLAGARPYYEQALAIRRQVVGEAHPDTANSLNNLGTLLRAQGDLAGARPYIEQAVAINRQTVGETHPNTANSLTNLGAQLQAQGDLTGARSYFEQALAIRRQVVGEAHPDTARSLNNLGSLLGGLGDYAGARSYLEQALAIQRQILGEMHLDTASSLYNMGSLLDSLGDHAGARPYYEQVLAIFERRLGPDHPTTRVVRGNLAGLEELG